METPIPEDVRTIIMERAEDGTWYIVLKGLGMFIGGFPIYNRELVTLKEEAGPFSGLYNALQVDWDYKGQWPFIPPNDTEYPEEESWEDDE